MINSFLSNLFVVDASIFPGHVTTNPSAYIVTAAEKASEKITALAANKALARYAQCGGQQWTGGFTCAAPYTCQWQNAYYSQVRETLPSSYPVHGFTSSADNGNHIVPLRLDWSRAW